MSLDSSLGLRKPDRLLRTRLLRRGCGYEPLKAEHLPYYWAAYKRGALDWPAGMEPEEFREHLSQRVAVLMENGGDAYTMLGRVEGRMIPVGVITTDVSNVPGVRRQIFPHHFWFPEAKPRHRIECTVRFYVDLKRQGNLLIVAGEENWRFFRHLCKYGVIRPLGKIRGHFSNGKDAMMYQGVNSEGGLGRVH